MTDLQDDEQDRRRRQDMLNYERSTRNAWRLLFGICAFFGFLVIAFQSNSVGNFIAHIFKTAEKVADIATVLVCMIALGYATHLLKQVISRLYRRFR